MIYILINIIIFLIGLFLIYIGFTQKQSSENIANIAISIGTSLVATGVVLALDLVRRNTNKRVNRRTKNILGHSGIQWVYEKRDLDKYDHLIKRVSDRLDICGYSLGAFFDSYGEIIKKRATINDLKIRVLFVNPNSEAARARAELEGKPSNHFEDRFNSFMNFFSGTSSVEIKTIDTPLSSMIYRIDNIMFIGPHFYKTQSKSTLTIELSKGSMLFNEYQKEFDRMWIDAK